jgi:NADH-quinone oxidoreductase subunit N
LWANKKGCFKSLFIDESQMMKALLQSITEDSAHLTPEIYLTGILLLFILTTPFFKKAWSQFGGWFSLAALIPLGLLYCNQYHVLIEKNELHLFGNMLLMDKQTLFFKVSFLASAVIYYLYYLASNKSDDDEQLGEYHFMIFSSLLGLNLVVMSSNLLIAFLAFETVSIASYSLVLFGNNKARPEAGIKYVIFGAVSTAVMLFGASIIYALNGTLDFSTLFNTSLIEGKDYYLIVYLFSGLFLVGGLFKLSIFPFHVWVPDVYQSIPIKLAAFFSYAPKVAGLAFVLNVMDAISDEKSRSVLALFLGVILIITLFVANLSALWQGNAKRLLAYSSITHSAYLLVGIFAYSKSGIESAMYYSTIYLFLNFAGFYLIEMLIKITGSEQIKSFSGLGVKRPFWGVLIVLTMIGLTGLPPTIGFTGKLWLFEAVFSHSAFELNNIYFWVLVLGLLNVAIALFYYLKIPFYMFFRKQEKVIEEKETAYHKVLAVVLSLPILILFFFNDWIFGLIHLFI